VISRNADKLMTVWIVPINNIGNTPSMYLKFIWKALLQYPGIGINADDWTVVSVGALYGEDAYACAGMTRLRM